ncbi:hypothetical protein QQS21_005167 [Conoideocrella luteorostrata]|uniref:Fucose-specific lectin n=1 Tax=Conoideocrella luteorostrata TaxID=1105319 RepID=A0AAJ0CSP2_9HYPO|nr:hypothetical protein QQS21_005167 [Conoideocrella luteorostrata]
MSSKSFSSSVIRGKDTYIFYNGRDTDDNPVIKYNRVRPDGRGSTSYLYVGDNTVPASDGPIAATNLFNGGLRLYVVSKRTIVEYGIDTPPGGEDEWKKEGFTSQPIQLAQGSFLNALGADEFSKYTAQDPKDPILLRIFYTSAKADDDVTQNTYTSKTGWVEKVIKS